MLDSVKNSQSLSDFKRNLVAVVAKVKETGDPVVLTVKGKAHVVIQDAVAYQRLREQADKAEMMEFLRESKADADAGRTVPAREFLRALGKKKAKKS